VTARGPADRGSGLLATAFGLTFFLAFLLAAAQLLLHLHARSVLEAVTDDAASRAARAVPLAQVEADARAALGRLGDGAAFEWGGDDDQLELRVVAPSPVSGPLGQLLGESLVEVARVRREAPR